LQSAKHRIAYGKDNRLRLVLCRATFSKQQAVASALLAALSRGSVRRGGSTPAFVRQEKLGVSFRVKVPDE